MYSIDIVDNQGNWAQSWQGDDLARCGEVDYFLRIQGIKTRINGAFGH